MSRRKQAETEPLITYIYGFYDIGNCDIGGGRVQAKSIGHAMQKIVAALPDEEPDHVYVWHHSKP